MIILKEKVVGYNNVLTLATEDMKFGVNEGVNYVKPVTPSVTPTTSPSIPAVTPKTSLSAGQPKTVVTLSTPDEVTYLLGTAVALGFLVARYVV